MKKKIKVNKNITIIAMLLAVIVIISSTTYAYFTGGVKGNKEAKGVSVESAIKSLKLNGTTIIGMEGMLPGDKHTIEFSVENTGTVELEYNLDMIEVENTLINKNELVYTIERESEQVKPEEVAPENETNLLENIPIQSKEEQHYKLTLEFKETGSNQNSNQGKEFRGRVQISNGGETIVTTVTAENGQIEGEDKKISKAGEEVTFKVSPNEGYEYESVSCDNEQTGEYDEENNTFTINPTKSATCTINFAEETKILKDKIIAKNQIKETKPDFKVGEPSADGSVTTGSGLYKWTEGDDSGNEPVYYFRGKVENNYVKFGQGKVNTYYIVGTSPGVNDYYFNTEEEAVNICKGSYSFYGYSTSDECIKDIKKYDDNEHDLIWRIVRINGDGSIRLILNEEIGNHVFNEDYLEDKYAGYTYENDSACTKNNPCTSTFDGNGFSNNKNGKDSDMKKYLEEWYKNNLTEEDDKIELEWYCNDTTMSTTTSNATKYYSSKERIEKGEPSLKCPETSETYGGNYKLKIGLITADELNLAGLPWHDNTNATANNYLYKRAAWWSMSPRHVDSFIPGIIDMGNGYMGTGDDIDQYHNIFPVINLKSNTLITTGNGTENNPYVVE